MVIWIEAAMRFMFCLPRFSVCNFAKATFLRILGAKVGRRCVFYPGVWIMTGRNLVLGDDVDLAFEVLVTTAGGVFIGDRSLIGYRTQIISGNHRIPGKDRRIFDAGHVHQPIRIENDVWIGANCVILPGVTIGEGAVIGAGSIVTKPIPAFSVAVGNPARVIRTRE
jgi:acetyltransferase-like isoleucine patch superfamily enzyme